ncbi:glycosyltransferase family 1 protein [Actinoalloteichus sp. AHMU CJ021]|uniref:glycosyltransferase family 4 protein n=1 Tax=Actinoalloteichus TaxID=65496 RepID=UPI0004AA7D7E|nr:glycosyltransferase family 4 protein [Actinoalloteichus caeruleus]AUS78099.1 glycosyltransferase family 1 protein [Actinoalloteichus sp. AHMU CJ021]
MRVLMLSWEYPPVVVGGLGRHVHALATRLARQGHEVVVLARHPAGSDATTHPTVEERREGVRVLRVAEDPPHLTFERDLVAWTLAMGHSMVREGMRLLRDWRPRVVHAHDWLVAHAATALADAADVPLVATLHATEAGRHSGWLSHSLNQQVHSVEWWLANRADLLITCSAAMRREVTHLFDVDAERVVVLHNGIDSHRWTGRPGTAALAAAPPPVPATGGAGASRDDAGGQRPSATRVAPGTRTALPAPDGAGSPVRTAAGRARPATLVFFGRLEWEKGVQDLIAALPEIRRHHPGTTLVVAGSGRHATELVADSQRHEVAEAVRFVGHLPDEQLAAVLSTADAAVFPSRYEPFGIVALEAAAARVPLVTSTAGGLAEVVRDGSTGVSFPPGDIPRLAEAVRQVLDDPAAARQRADAAFARLATDFDWDRIAADTAREYEGASRRPATVLGRPKIPSGNVFGAGA